MDKPVYCGAAEETRSTQQTNIVLEPLSHKNIKDNRLAKK